MVMVLIVGAVVLAFCLSLMMLSYSLFSQTARQTGRKQCKILAQGLAETIGQELSDPQSELSEYLSEQIRAGRWVSTVAGNDAGQAQGADSTGLTELKLNLDDGGTIGAYRLSVTLTYTQNGVYGGTIDAEDADHSEDDTGDGTITVLHTVHATIKCIRGNETDRDVQYYVMESDHPDFQVVFPQVGNSEGATGGETEGDAGGATGE